MIFIAIKVIYTIAPNVTIQVKVLIKELYLLQLYGVQQRLFTHFMLLI